MEIPVSMAFELLGRKEAMLEMQRRQIASLLEQAREMQTALDQWRERAQLAVQPCGGNCSCPPSDGAPGE